MILEVNKTNDIPMCFAHFTFADFDLSTVPKRIDKKLGLITTLKNENQDYKTYFDDKKLIADCVVNQVNASTVFSLIMETNRFKSVTFTHLQVALHALRQMCLDSDINDLVIYMHGLSNLERKLVIPVTITKDHYNQIKTLAVESRVINAIEYEFEDTDIKVVCCAEA